MDSHRPGESIFGWCSICDAKGSARLAEVDIVLRMSPFLFLYGGFEAVTGEHDELDAQSKDIMATMGLAVES